MIFKRIAIFISVFSLIVSCVKEPAGNDYENLNVTGKVELFARLGDGTKASVTETGLVSWQNTDNIGVYTSNSTIETFNVSSIDGGVAVFTASLHPGVLPHALAVYPALSFKSLEEESAVISYPATYVYENDAMRAPMVAIIGSDNELSFRHVGGLIRVSCPAVPSDAVSFCLVAEGKKIAGNFTEKIHEDMTVASVKSSTNNSVSISFTAGTDAMSFNIPIPIGEYGKITAKFVDSDGSVLNEYELYSALSVQRADMYVTSLSSVNGSLIDANNTRIGLVADENGKGIAGVPVTDGYTYTTTDKNGVYQFIAREDARAVYLSHPAGYELPVDKNGQHFFWGKESYRNDFTLTKRAVVTDEFTILAFTDVHFFNEGSSSNDEQTGYNNTTLPDINNYIQNFENLIAINCGDVVTNVTEKLSTSKSEFAKIKKGGKTVPMLMTIGNHDYDNGENSALASTQDWFNVYGPTDYSVNIGKAHIVCMSNIIYKGQNDGGYGKSIQYDKGLTEEQWAWLQADLEQVQNKSDKMLIMCFHCPIGSNGYAHAGDIRNLLKTFGEAHIFSGHNHYNAPRQFTDSWKGLSGRIPYEHNMPALGGLWRGTKKTFGVKTEHSSIGNDGTPNSYHVYQVKGNEMTAQYFKAVGNEATYQFRIYDGGASYHDPVDNKYSSLTPDKDGKFYFDWKSLWESSEGFDPTGHFIVRVFDAGSRGLNCNVYFTKNGVRSPMTRVAATHRDQCTFSYLWNNDLLNSNSDYAKAYTTGKTQSFWYYKAPSGAPATETNWKVEVEFVEPDGTRVFESNKIQKDYTGFSHSIY